MWNFRVELANDQYYLGNSPLGRIIHLHAEDLISAIMKAHDIVLKLREELKDKAIPDLETLRLREIKEEYEIVGDVGCYPDKELGSTNLNDWVHKVTKKTVEDIKDY